MTNQQQTTIGLIMAAVLGMGGGAGFNLIVDPRADPFTGRNANDMEMRIYQNMRDYVKNNYPYNDAEKARMARVEEKLDRILERTVTDHALLIQHLNGDHAIEHGLDD